MQALQWRWCHLQMSVWGLGGTRWPPESQAQQPAPAPFAPQGLHAPLLCLHTAHCMRRVLLRNMALETNQLATCPSCVHDTNPRRVLEGASRRMRTWAQSGHGTPAARHHRAHP